MKNLQHILALILLMLSISCNKPEAENIDPTDFKSNFQAKKKTLKVKLITKEAPFEKREGHTSVTFNNKIWIIGGYEGYGGNPRNDIWQSKDGMSWTKLLATKHFSPRTSHTTTLFKDKLWVIGGNEIPNRKNDVWHSEDGIIWKEVTDKANFSSRSSHTALSFNDKLWVIGGLDQDKNPLNDVWQSKNGVDWIQVTSNAAFSPRFNHTAFVFDNKIWVIGGKDGIGASNKVSVKNDVWYSKNGIDWVQATSEAPFLPRSGHTSAVYDNSIWVLGGSDKSSNKIGDAWCSKDGSVWKPVAESEFLKRTAHTTTVFDKKMWVIAGINDFTTNDVWALQ